MSGQEIGGAGKSGPTSVDNQRIGVGVVYGGVAVKTQGCDVLTMHLHHFPGTFCLTGRDIQPIHSTLEPCTERMECVIMGQGVG